MLHLNLERLLGAFLYARCVLRLRTVVANIARIGSRQLQGLTPEQRACAVNTLADLLVSREAFILEANAKDLAEAQRNGLAKPLLSRLSLNTGKLRNLSVGLKQIADSSHNVSIHPTLYMCNCLY